MSDLLFQQKEDTMTDLLFSIENTINNFNRKYWQMYNSQCCFNTISAENTMTDLQFSTERKYYVIHFNMKNPPSTNIKKELNAQISNT